MLSACLSVPAIAVADEVERIPITFPEIKSPELPPVFFTHEKHMEYVERLKGDCTSCHVETEEGMSPDFLHIKKQPADKQVAYIHAACTDCHAKANAGPRLVECRTCHDRQVAQAQAQ